MGKRNPNGYGCVTKLKGNRSRPWVVKVTRYDEEGNGKQIPVGYAKTEVSDEYDYVHDLQGTSN